MIAKALIRTGSKRTERQFLGQSFDFIRVHVTTEEINNINDTFGMVIKAVNMWFPFLIMNQLYIIIHCSGMHILFHYFLSL